MLLPNLACRYAAKCMPKSICKSPVTRSAREAQRLSADSPLKSPTRRVSFAPQLEEVRTINSDSALSDPVVIHADHDTIATAIESDGAIAALDIPELEFDDTAFTIPRRAAQRGRGNAPRSPNCNVMASGPSPPVVVTGRVTGNGITNAYKPAGPATQAADDADLIWASMFSSSSADIDLGECVDNAVTAIQPTPVVGQPVGHEANASPIFRRLGTAQSSHETDNDC